MKMQWTIILGLIFALIIAIFATVNVGRVPINYIFGKAYWPLILVIIGATLIGVMISACFSVFRLYKQSRMISELQKELLVKETQVTESEKRYFSLDRNGE